MEEEPPGEPGELGQEIDDQRLRELDAKVGKLKGFLDKESSPVGQQFYQGILLVTYLGVFFVVALLIPTAIGWYLDAKYRSTPWLTMAGIVLGLGAGISGCYKIVRSYWERLL